MTSRKITLIEENIYISLILTFIGGFLDAYTYILYDQIFANTQTGNIIFFTIFLVEGNIYNAFLRIFPIISFCIAIFITQLLIHKFNENKKWIKIILLLNIILTITIGTGIFKNISLIIVCLVSFICATMIGTFKKADGNVFAPTMCTGNLRSLMEFFSKWIIHKERESKKIVIKYISIIFTFCLGIAIGIILVNILQNYSIYLCSLLFFIVFLIIKYKI